MKKFRFHALLALSALICGLSIGKYSFVNPEYHSTTSHSKAEKENVLTTSLDHFSAFDLVKWDSYLFESSKETEEIQEIETSKEVEEENLLNHSIYSSLTTRNLLSLLSSTYSTTLVQSSNFGRSITLLYQVFRI